MANSTTTQENKPNSVSGFNQLMKTVWHLITSLRNGTDAMRAGTTDFIPKEESETKKKYENRVARSFLFNAYDETVSSIASKPFSKEITIEGDEADEFVALIKDDADGEGRNLTQFSHDAYETGIDYGMLSILVDFPNEKDEEGEDLSLGAERALSIRPKFVLIKRPSILGYREDPDKAGRLIQIRIYEPKVEPFGDFGECEVEYVRVYQIDRWALFRKNPESGEWDVHDQGVNSLGEIPIVNIYFNRTGFMTARPCLESLAWLNLQHFQSGSDQNNILRFARTGTFFGAGFAKDEITTSLKIGVDNFIKSTNPEAKLQVVEFKGQAIKAGSDDMKQIEDRMEMLGLQPMVQQANSTATGATINNNKKETFAQSWVRALNGGLNTAYEIAHKWYKKELPKDFKISIFDDFGATGQTDDSMDKIFVANTAGLLQDKTVLQEMQRRDIINSDIDIDDELAAASEDFEGRIVVETMGDDKNDENKDDENKDDEPNNDNKDDDKNKVE